MKSFVVGTVLSLGLILPSVSMACGMYIPKITKGKTVVLADALDEIDALDEKAKKTEELKPTEAKAEEGAQSNKEGVKEESKPNA